VYGEGKRAAIPHVDALDGARGLAVAGVLLFHGGHLIGGYLGVDFFFTLSGFLITSLLLSETNRTGGVGLGGFWARRARRLLPALGVLIVMVAVYCVTVATPDQLTQIRGDAFATLAYVANWREVFSHRDYFALFSSPSPLNHTWSLAIEEQFYLIWPLLFVGLLAWWKRAIASAVLVVSIVLAAGSSILMMVLYRPGNVARAYFGTDTRAAAILFGAALAAWLALHGPIRNPRGRVALEGLGLISAVGLGVAWVRLDGSSPFLYHGGFLLCALGATVVIAAAVHPEPGPLSRLLSLRALVALGLISYGVYLYHWPIDLILDQKRVSLSGWPLFAIQTAVTIAFAVASYRIVEQPIRHGALSSVQLRKLTPAIAVGLVLLVSFTTLDAHPVRTVTALKFPAQAAARAFREAPPNAKRVMIVGDSVGYFLGQSMKTVKETPPIAVFNAATEGCTFPPQVSQTRRYNAYYHTNVIQPTFGCDPRWEPRAVANFRPDIVFWFINSPADAVKVRGQWIDSCSAAYASLYERSLRAELTMLGASGSKVVFTTEVYPRYLFATQDRTTDCENRVRRKVAAETKIQLVDLLDYICPQGHCREKLNGSTLRPDGEHYEGAGGEIVARWLLDQVK
jgi:peptidoglycan/LPS O-acetylase OafA/YrhL